MTVKRPFAGAERSPTSGKQRSIHMDDETFDLLKSLAAKHKANNSTIVRMALMAYADSGRAVGASPLLAAPYGEPRLDGAIEVPSTTASNTRNIAAPGVTAAKLAEPIKPAMSHLLPDPAVSSFKVDGGRVVGRRPRNDREDDGLDV